MEVPPASRRAEWWRQTPTLNDFFVRPTIPPRFMRGGTSLTSPICLIPPLTTIPPRFMRGGTSSSPPICLISPLTIPPRFTRGGTSLT